MNKTEKKTVKEYLNKVTSALSCSWSLKKVFASELKSQIKEHFGSEEITYDKLCTTFGTPEKISAGFYDRQEYEKMLKKAKKLNRILVLLSLALVIAIVLLLIIVFHLYDMVGDTITIGGVQSYTFPIYD